jgi:hypothetical protein
MPVPVQQAAGWSGGEDPGELSRTLSAKYPA